MLSPVARAQTDAVQRENARALYKAGNDARDAGVMKTAAAKYKIAYALVQTPVIAVALGKAQMALGQLIEARQTWLGAGTIPTKPRESELTTSARAEARELAAEIEPRIPTVTLVIATPAGVPLPSVTMDGVMVPAVTLNSAWKVDPGPHAVVVTLGEVSAETLFSVAEAEVREVPLDSPSVPSPLVVTTPPEARTLAPPIQGAPAHGPSRVPAHVALGVGAAGVVVTTVFGALALSDQSALHQGCMAGPRDCPTRAQSDINALHTNSIASDVGLGVAVVGLGVGGALLLFPRRSPHSGEMRDVHVEPWVGVGALGMTGSF